MMTLNGRGRGRRRKGDEESRKGREGRGGEKGESRDMYHKNSTYITTTYGK
jgi:hypothetical protein